MTQREQRDSDILMEMYRRAFAASTPPADFDALVAEAETNALVHSFPTRRSSDHRKSVV